MNENGKKTVIIYLIVLAAIAVGICFYRYKHVCCYKGCTQEKYYGSEYCYNHTCKEKGCNGFKESSERWCATHKAQYEEENRKWLEDYNSRPDCAVNGCESKAVSGGRYCVVHECTVLNCENRCVEGGLYCINHTCKETGCFNRVNARNSMCDECGKKAEMKKNAETSHKNENSSTKKKSNGNHLMPDCDDYDSYEEFMDDWDGFMPDGSDAEDYWENW